MPKTLVATLLATFAVLPAIAAQPAPTGEPIEVRGDRVGWSGAMAASIGDNLRYPYVVGVNRQPSGIVKIAFRGGADGRPTDVTVLESSRFAVLDKAAITAVERAATAHPIPAAGDDRRIQAWVYFADTEREERKLSRRLMAEAAARPQLASVDGMVLIAGQ